MTTLAQSPAHEAEAPPRTRRIDWEAVAAAELHRLRIVVIGAAVRRGEISASDLARETGEELGTVSYHVRQLADSGVLEPVRTERHRGAIKTFYRLAPAFLQEADES